MRTIAFNSKSATTLTSWLVIALLTIQAVLLAYGACVESPTLNEPGHLVAGISNWQFGRFDICKVNPPLVQMVAAVPVLLAGATTDWSAYSDAPGARPELTLGQDFVAANGERSFWLFSIARWACIPFCLLGGYFCFRWARELYGSGAGLMALTLWCFCPNILAHGQLITCDVAATSLGLVACYAFWNWLKHPIWENALIASLTLGVAELTKMTLIVFCPLWIVMWAIYRWPERNAMSKQKWLRESAMLCVQMLLMSYLVNFGYGFEGSFTRLGDFRFVSSAFRVAVDTEKLAVCDGNRFAGTWLNSLPVPLPKNYLLGIDLQKRDFEKYNQLSYLRGEFREKGWWYYYLYALAIKVPLGTWTLLFLAGLQGLWAKVRVQWRDEFILLSPAIVIFAFVSSQNGFSQHMRYVLPAFPFVFVWIGRISVAFDRKRWGVITIAFSALLWSIVSALSVYPNTLSYFNELAGGPTGGPKHLIHSNVDWGQDLLFLKKWLAQHPEARPLTLAYYGCFDPKHAGIDYTAPTEIANYQASGSTNFKIPSGWYAISVNFIQGFPYFVYQGDGSKVALRKDALVAFRDLEPVAMAGNSIYVYHVLEPQASTGPLP